MEREKKKQEEYTARESVDFRELGVSKEELTQMKEMDFLYGGSTTEDELEEMETEEEQKLMDPYLKEKVRKIKPQQFRSMTIGPSNLLKNGQMI